MSTTDLSWMGTTLVVWAHPDDETYLCGGIVAALVDLGHRVVAVNATRGEAGSDDLTPEGRAATAALRTAELEEALAVLGVREHHWLGYEDGRCEETDPEDAVRRLAEILDDVRPDTLLTFGPDGVTGHPDHRAVSGWVDLALARATARPRLLHAVATEQDLGDPELDEDFGVYDLGRPRLVAVEDAAVRLVLDPASLRRKVTALEAQASQTAGLIEAVGLARFSAWVAVETFAEPAALAAH